LAGGLGRRIPGLEGRHCVPLHGVNAIAEYQNFIDISYFIALYSIIYPQGCE
jgi:hypothetical protein